MHFIGSIFIPEMMYLYLSFMGGCGSMFKFFMKNMKKNQKGFTLTELMVVVVIIGILAAIAVPVYRVSTQKANRSAVEANLRTIDGAITQFMANEESGAPSESTLTGKYIKSWPMGPDGVTYTVTGDGSDSNPYTAAAVKGADTGSWYTGDATKTLPISW